MDNKVDKLFKDKLEGDSIQPSAQAWEKVEAHLGKKNKVVLWLRVAAAIALLVAVSFVVLNWNKDYEAPAKEFVKAPQPKQEDVKQPVAESQKTEDRSQKTEDRSQKPEGKEQVAKTHSIKRKQNVVDTQDSKSEIQDPKLEEQLAIVEEPATPNPEHQTPNTEHRTTNTEQKTQKGITLTYSLPSVKKPVAEPMIAEVKKKGLERVLEIAKDVKNSDSPLADLREVKDDIFALDFKKDKKKTNQGF